MLKQSTFGGLSLFSGCGGFCEGMAMAGASVLRAVELDKYAVDTYEANFRRTPISHVDIANFLRRNTRHDRAKLGIDDIDVVFGGPPCQGYSQIGTRKIDDERNNLYEQFARVLRFVRPRMFLMENVPNMVRMHKGYFRDRIVQVLSQSGYRNTSFVHVSAADYGVPQERERVVFFGTRDGELRSDFRLTDFFLSALESRRDVKRVTVRQAIGDLPSKVAESGQLLPYPSARRYSRYQTKVRLGGDLGPYSAIAQDLSSRPHDGMLHNHHTKRMLQRRQEIVSLLKPGANGKSLPSTVWSGARAEKWRRLHPDQPAYTILAQMHRDLSEWVHPWLDRWITVREAARLQSFHDSFVFRTSEWQQLKQIGNAVPPMLGYALGAASGEVIAAIKKH